MFEGVVGVGDGVGVDVGVGVGVDVGVGVSVGGCGCWSCCCLLVLVGGVFVGVDVASAVFRPLNPRLERLWWVCERWWIGLAPVQHADSVSKARNEACLCRLFCSERGVT